jgi:hypothetical protein
MALVVGLALAGRAIVAFGFAEADARRLGLGGAYVAVARGVRSVNVNPANLALPRDRKLSIELFSFGGGIGNNAIPLDLYNDVNGGTRWTDAQKQKILDAVEGGKLDIAAAFEVLPLFNVAYDRFALTVVGQGAAKGTIPPEPIDLLLFGNRLGQRFSLDAAGGSGWGIIGVQLSASHPFTISQRMIRWLPRNWRQIAVGGTVKILHGLAFAGVERSSGFVETREGGIAAEGEFITRRAGFNRPSKGGSGFALDLGVAAQPDERLSVSLVLQNLLGQMIWQDDVLRERVAFGAEAATAADLLADGDGDDTGAFERLFNAGIDTTDASFVDPRGRWVPGFSFTTDYPALMRMGAAYQVRPRDLLLAFEYEQGFNDNPGVSKTPRLSIGGEYTPRDFLALRMGFAAGGVFGRVSSLGLGLRAKAFRFDVASAVQEAFLPNNAEGVGFALNLGLDF